MRLGQRVFADQAAPVLIAVACLVAVPALAFPQSRPPDRRLVVTRTVMNFAELAQQEKAAPPRPVKQKAIPFMRIPKQPLPPEAAAAPRAAAAQFPVVPPGPPPLAVDPSPAPATSFQALDDNDTGIPPDTQGAVGTSHLMVMLNTEVRIQDRTGGQLGRMSLETFWSGTGATSIFDPRVEYDPFNNRWIVSGASNRESATSSLLIGASATSDPTGTWHLYRIDADSTNVNWADYPSLGFNKDWVVVTVNMFAVSGGAFARSDIHVFRKSQLYAGAMSVTDAVFPDSSSGFAPAVTYDNSLATLYMAQNMDGNSGGSGSLRLATITGAVGSEMFTIGASVSTPNPWDDMPPNGSDFALQDFQKDSFHRIQNNDSRILKVIYRNGSLWASQTVFLPAGGPPTRSAAQWWQFTPAGAVQQFGRVEGGKTPLQILSIPNTDLDLGIEHGCVHEDSNGNLVDSIVYARTLIAVGGAPPGGFYSWSLAPGSAFPPGTTVETDTGIFRWNGGALVPGTYTFTMQVSDGVSLAEKAFTYTIDLAQDPPGGPPSFCGVTVFPPPFRQTFDTNSFTIPAAAPGQLYGVALFVKAGYSGTGSETGNLALPLTWTLAQGGQLPPGLTLNPSTGVVYG
ncbi:MAG: putative Ig domain-containing protein, partial [Terriglobales bacterium]